MSSRTVPRPMFRRLSPRIRQVEYDGTSSASVTFDRDMDTLQEDAVVIITDESGSIHQFTDFSWDDSRTMSSTTGEVVGTHDAPLYAKYLRGNLRARARYRLWNYSRTDRVSPNGGGGNGNGNGD